MTEKLRNLIEQKNKLVTDMRVALDRVDKEERSLTSEEDTTYATMETDLDKALDDIKAEEKSEERARKLAMIEGASFDPNRALANQDANITGDNQATQPTEREVRAKLAKKWEVKADFVLGTLRSKPEYEDAFIQGLIRGDKVSDADRQTLEAAMGSEIRALQGSIDIAGGYLIVPERFIAELIKEKDNLLWFRQFARKLPVTDSGAINMPELGSRMSNPVWTSEILTGDADTSMKFKKRALSPSPLAKRIKVSKTLIRLAALPVDSIVRTEMAFQFAETEENHYMNGHGSNQPLGIFTASNAGISTGRDISTGNTTTAIKADNLRECRYALKAQYRRNCRWAFHRDAIKMISKLKDGEGNYLWQPGIRAGDPDVLLGYPVMESEYVPSTFSTGKYVGIIGDFSQYYIAESLRMQIQVVTELYAETNENGYIGRAEIDGAPIDENAFVRVKLA